MQENKEFYVVIKGEKVVVTEEVYRAYVRPIRKEQRRKRRTWKCQVKGKKGNLVRCKKDCSKCEFAMSGHNATGKFFISFTEKVFTNRTYSSALSALFIQIHFAFFISE